MLKKYNFINYNNPAIDFYKLKEELNKSHAIIINPRNFSLEDMGLIMSDLKQNMIKIIAISSISKGEVDARYKTLFDLFLMKPFDSNAMRLLQEFLN